MKRPFSVWRDVYAIGGPDITEPSDCCVYLINAGELILIDCGVGDSFNQLVDNISVVGCDPERLRAIIVTHAHIDHIGAVAKFQQRYGVTVIAHELDAPKVESGRGTGAEFYGVGYQRCVVNTRISQPESSLSFGAYQLYLMHIPGHTPGSLAIYVDMGKRILFGQDIHGPYVPEWGADPVQAAASLQKLLDVKADILCEGHFGVYQPASEVRRYIESYWRQLERKDSL